MLENMNRPSETTRLSALIDTPSHQEKIRLLAVIAVVLDLAVIALELTRIMPGNTVKNVSDFIILGLLILLLIKPRWTWCLAVIGIGECAINIYYGGHILGFLYFMFGLAVLLKEGFFRSRRAWKVAALSAFLAAVTLSQLWTFSLKRFTITVVNIVLAGVIILGFLYLFHDALRGFYREKPVLDLSRCGLSPRQLACVRGCMEDKRIRDLAAELCVSESVVKKELLGAYERLGVADYRELRFRLDTSRVLFPES